MFLSLRVTSCGEAFSGLPTGLLLTSAQSLLEQGRYVLVVGLFCPDTLPVWSWAAFFSGLAMQVSRDRKLLLLQPGQERAGAVSAKPERADHGRTQLNSGSAGFASLWSHHRVHCTAVLGPTEQVWGLSWPGRPVFRLPGVVRWGRGGCLDSVLGELYLVWPRCEGLMMKPQLFTLTSGCLQAHLRDRG